MSYPRVANCSGHVDEIGLVSLVALHVVLRDQHLDLLFNHLRVRLEHRDVAHNVCLEVLETVLLLRLHDLHNVSLHDECALSLDLTRLLLFLSRCLGRLLANHLLWDQVRANLA